MLSKFFLGDSVLCKVSEYISFFLHSDGPLWHNLSFCDFRFKYLANFYYVSTTDILCSTFSFETEENVPIPIPWETIFIIWKTIGTLMSMMSWNWAIFTIKYRIVDFSTLNYFEITGLNDPGKHTYFFRNTQITDPYSFCLYIFSIGESNSHERMKISLEK